MEEALRGRYLGQPVDPAKLAGLKNVSRKDSPVEFKATPSFLEQRSHLRGLAEGTYLALLLRVKKDQSFKLLVADKFPHKTPPADESQLHASHRSMLRAVQDQFGLAEADYEVIAGGEFARLQMINYTITSYVSNGTGTFSINNGGKNLVALIRGLRQRGLEIDGTVSFQNYASGLFPDPHEGVDRQAMYKIQSMQNRYMDNYIAEVREYYQYHLRKFPHLNDPMRRGHLDIEAIFFPALQALRVSPDEEARPSVKAMETNFLQTMDLIQKIHTDGFEFVAAIMIQQRLKSDFIGKNTDLALLLGRQGQKHQSLPEFLEATSRGNADFFPEQLK